MLKHVEHKINCFSCIISLVACVSEFKSSVIFYYLLLSPISLLIRTTCTPPSSLPYHSSPQSSLITEYAPAVCYNEGWRSHMKGGLDKKHGESEGHGRGNLPSFSFRPPFLGLFFFPFPDSSRLFFKFEDIYHVISIVFMVGSVCNMSTGSSEASELRQPLTDL